MANVITHNFSREDEWTFSFPLHHLFGHKTFVKDKILDKTDS